MMCFDSKAVSILFALIGTIVFVIVELIKKNQIRLMNIVVIFLACYGISAGFELIKALLAGDPTKLPESWREYLAVAGVVCFGLSIIEIFKKITRKSMRAEKIKINGDIE